MLFGHCRKLHGRGRPAKVLAQLRQPAAPPGFRRLGAVGFITPPLAQQRFKGIDYGIADPYFSTAPAKRYRI